MKLSTDLNKDELFDQLCESAEEICEKKENDRCIQDAFDTLFSTMAEKHVEFVISEMKHMGEMRKAGKKFYPNELTLECGFMVVCHYVNTINGLDHMLSPLAMPQEVAEIYLNDQDATALSDCSKCRFCSPVSLTPGGKAHKHFTHCPLCGTEL